MRPSTLADDMPAATGQIAHVRGWADLRGRVVGQIVHAPSPVRPRASSDHPRAIRAGAQDADYPVLAMPDHDLPPPALPWWLITLGTVGLLGLYVVAVRTLPGQRVDNEIMWRLQVGPDLAQQLLPLLAYAGPVVMVGLCVLACLYGLTRGWRTAAGAATGVLVCLAAPQVLKLALPRPQLADPWPLPNSLPSGHAAAVAALVVALLVVVPRSARGAVLILGSTAVGVMGLLLITLGHHRLSDIAASGCVGLIGWGVGLLVQGQRRLPEPARGGSFGGHSPSSDPSSVA